MKTCANCDFELTNQDLEEKPHCPRCGANLKAKKYKKADDPSTTAKELEETKTRLTKLEAENATIKKTLQDKDDSERTTRNEPKRTLFGN